MLQLCMVNWKWPFTWVFFQMCEVCGETEWIKTKWFKWFPDKSCLSEYTDQNRACQRGDLVHCAMKYWSHQFHWIEERDTLSILQPEHSFRLWGVTVFDLRWGFQMFLLLSWQIILSEAAPITRLLSITRMFFGMQTNHLLANFIAMANNIACIQDGIAFHVDRQKELSILFLAFVLHTLKYIALWKTQAVK